MNINLQVRLHTEDAPWLCFRDAVVRSNQGEDVELDVDEYGEYWMGRTHCVDCASRLRARSDAQREEN